MSAERATNPFLTGNFAPVRSEDDFELSVKGTVPQSLAGALFRIGPNPQFETRDPRHHLFTGDGMVHGFYFADGKVRYRNRYVRTPRWLDENRAGRSLYGSFGNPATTDPSVMGRDFNAANTHVVHHAGKLLALEEAHMPIELDPVSLDTIGYVESYKERITAHPKFDPDTGEMVWFAYNVGPTPFSAELHFGTTGADGSIVRREGIEAPYCSMIHDFMVTRDYAVVPVLPLTGSLQRAMQGKPAFAWEPEKGAHLAVIRRDGTGDVRWFRTNLCHIYHPMNAWQEGKLIFADVMRYDAAPFFPTADGSPTSPSSARLVRWTIDLDNEQDEVQEQPIGEIYGEFPRIDPRFETKKYRHGWLAASDAASRAFQNQSMIAHVDVQAGESDCYRLEPGDQTSEPVFVPASSDSAEGEGHVLAVVYRAAEDRSDLLAFGALDLAAGPLATIRLPRRVPFGFHGTWVAQDRF